jgi:hypothetical protein
MGGGWLESDEAVGKWESGGGFSNLNIQRIDRGEGSRWFA